MKVERTETGLTARQMTPKQIEGLERQLQDNGVAYSKDIDLDDMDYTITATYGDIYAVLPEHQSGAHQGRGR